MRRWKELGDDLDAHGVQVVTLCPDTPAQIRRGRRRHGLGGVMLSDRDLAVARRYGVDNRNPAARPPGVPGVPIPTTILADAGGIVRWIDQSDDYQLRSRPDRIRAVLREVFG